MKIAIVNIGQIVSGNWHEPFATGDAILIDGEHITSVGSTSADAVSQADVVIDADGMTAIPAGNNAKVYGLDSGLLAPGEAADLVLLDAPDGGNHAQGAGCIVA